MKPGRQRDPAILEQWIENDERRVCRKNKYWARGFAFYDRGCDRRYTCLSLSLDVCVYT